MAAYFCSPVQQTQPGHIYDDHMEELHPCIGEEEQVERDKLRSPEPTVSGTYCYLPKNVSQEKSGVPQMQVQDGNGAPCYLPKLQDKFPPPKATTAEGQESQKMGVTGPWTTGHVDWGPLAELTRTRPMVDKYSITRYSEGEWRKHNADVLKGSDKETHHAKVVDHNGRQCATFTVADTNKTQNENTKRLSHRVHDVYRWKVELEHAISTMSDEINTLELQKQRLKTAMGVLHMPESIAGECLSQRTARLEPDIVRDKAEEELIKETALIGEARDFMGRMLKQIEEQLQHNKAIKKCLEIDWSDKKETYDIEAINVGLRNTSKTLLFKPGATRFPDVQSTPESWEHYTRENLNQLEEECKRSTELRHFLDSFMSDMSRDLCMQADCVDTALAMRIAETDEARQRLENELLKTLKCIADTEKLIKDLKQAIINQDPAMKIAQTRLDNRMLRPRQENCRDIPQYELVDEVKSISKNVSALKGQLQQAEESLCGLVTMRADLEQEIIVKRKTLQIDRDRCQKIRSYYPSTVTLTGY
ncbi:tektin-4 isoform X2 [Zootermopsis nevadensis]|uniref:tektin-4 isoform X2 n=1 Tax=Zootermopsis nevadensis TaxID=136037 RepID=UPI000B8E81F4|nr:tektin-4 isoform X2 [Zootermopsis nevadensis]